MPVSDEPFVPDEELLGDEVSGADLDSFWDDDDDSADSPDSNDGDSNEENSDDEDGSDGDSDDSDGEDSEDSEESTEEDSDDSTDDEDSEEDDESDEDSDESEEDDESDEDSEDEEDEDTDSSEEDNSVASVASRIGKKILEDRQSSEDPKADEKIKAEARTNYLTSLGVSSEDLTSITDEVGAINFPEGEIEIDGQKMDLNSFSKEYPQAVAISKLLAVHVSKKMVDTQVAKLQKSIDKEEFFNELSYFHSDVRQLSRTPAFKSWVAGSTPEIQAMVRDSVIENVALAINLYKEETGETPEKKEVKVKKKVEKKKVNKKKLEKKKKLLSKNVGGKKRSTKKKGYDKFDTSEAALDAAFDEDD